MSSIRPSRAPAPAVDLEALRIFVIPAQLWRHVRDCCLVIRRGQSWLRRCARGRWSPWCRGRVGVGRGVGTGVGARVGVAVGALVGRRSWSRRPIEVGEGDRVVGPDVGVALMAGVAVGPGLADSDAVGVASDELGDGETPGTSPGGVWGSMAHAVNHTSITVSPIPSALARSSQGAAPTALGLEPEGIVGSAIALRRDPCAAIVDNRRAHSVRHAGEIELDAEIGRRRRRSRARDHRL